MVEYRTARADETKPWRYREKAVKYLKKALREFEKQSGQ